MSCRLMVEPVTVSNLLSVPPVLVILVETVEFSYMFLLPGPVEFEFVL